MEGFPRPCDTAMSHLDSFAERGPIRWSISHKTSAAQRRSNGVAIPGNLMSLTASAQQEFGVIHTHRLGRVREAFVAQCGAARTRNQSIIDRVRQVSVGHLGTTNQCWSVVVVAFRPLSTSPVVCASTRKLRERQSILCMSHRLTNIVCCRTGTCYFLPFEPIKVSRQKTEYSTNT